MESKNTAGIPLLGTPHKNTLVRFFDDTFVRHAFEDFVLYLAQEGKKNKEHLYKEQVAAASEKQ